MLAVVIFGTGGHAKVVYDILVKQNIYKPVAFISLNHEIKTFLDLPHFHQEQFANSEFNSGIVAIGDNFTRNKVVDYILSQRPQFKFIKAIHPSAQIGHDVSIGDGSVVMAHVAVNSGTRIASHVILNTGASIDHDCDVKNFASIVPGCVLGGNVEVGEFSAISLGANIIHGKKVGSHSVIGAGSLVLKNVESCKVAYGNPCSIIRDRARGEKYL